jgi:crotonobetainyl-CoA:carnitine CoA-transferase CaiB-like acyl-CoA transferase
MSGPFADLVVVDVATLNAAPQIATFFGDLGARVIKVEHPRGDPLRQLVDATALRSSGSSRTATRRASRSTSRSPTAARSSIACSRAPTCSSRRSPASGSPPGARRTTLRARHPRLVAVNLTTYRRERPVGRSAGLRHARRGGDGPRAL